MSLPRVHRGHSPYSDRLHGGITRRDYTAGNGAEGRGGAQGQATYLSGSASAPCYTLHAHSDQTSVLKQPSVRLPQAGD